MATEDNVLLNIKREYETLQNYVAELEALARHYILSEELVISSYIDQAALKLKSAIQTIEAGLRQ